MHSARRAQLRSHDPGVFLSGLAVGSDVKLTYVADFEGIPLAGKGSVAGSLLIPRTAPPESGIVRLPGDVEVEIRQGIRAVIVRGIAGSDYESVLTAAPELANKGLDIFAMTGLVRLALEDIWLTHVVWWRTPDSTAVRFWCSSTLTMTLTATGEVRGPDGEVKRPAVQPTPKWQESMRYFRMSELTDDLFDAFRNIYLALESLLSLLEPVRITRDGHASEREGVWFRRALAKAATLVDLREYARDSTSAPTHVIYNELHNSVRNRVFHAKDGMQPFLPQDLSSRAQVAEAKNRYSRFYLALAEKVFEARFPVGGTTLSRLATSAGLKSITQDWNIAITSDPAPTDGSEQELSPSGESCITLPSSQFKDPRSDAFAAIIAKTAVPELASAVPAVGRIATMNRAGQLGLICSLEGRLALMVFDQCEFVMSLGLAGRQIRKTLYAT